MKKSRSFRLRELLGRVVGERISQRRFGDLLRLSQSAVNDLEHGSSESGPVSLLLDHLESVLASGDRASAQRLLDDGLIAAAAPPELAPDLTRHQSGFGRFA